MDKLFFRHKTPNIGCTEICTSEILLEALNPASKLPLSVYMVVARPDPCTEIKSLY